MARLSGFTANILGSGLALVSAAMTTRPRLRISVRPSSSRPLMLAMVLMTAGVTARAGAAGRPIDTEQSTITVHVFTGGLFAGFGDNHEIRGAVKRGTINDSNPADVHIVVDAASFRVLDPGASAKNRAAVQMRMLGPDVLDVNRFPEILRFRVSRAQRSRRVDRARTTDAARPDPTADDNRQRCARTLQRIAGVEAVGLWDRADQSCGRRRQSQRSADD